MPKATDPNLIQRAVDMYEQGQTGRVAAKEVGIAESVLYRALKSRGIDAASLQRRGERGHANRRFTDEVEESIAADYANGASLSQLGEKHGVVLQTIRNVLRRRGISRRNRGNVVRGFSDDAVADMVALWEGGAGVTAIATALGTSTDTVRRVLRLRGIQIGARHATADRHGNWNGGRWRLGSYVMVRVPTDSPYSSMQNTQGYVMEHRLVMAEALGRPLLASETVHHINDIGDDNRIENLQLRQGKHGKGAVHYCLDCGSTNIGSKELAPKGT